MLRLVHDSLALFVSASVTLSPLPASETIGSDVLICPAASTSTDDLIAVDYPRATGVPGSPVAFVYGGDGALNTFAPSPSTEATCTPLSMANLVARQVTARIPRDACASDDTAIASDLLVFETSVPLETTHGSLFAVRADGASLGKLIAAAGSYVVVNVKDHASARLGRATRARLDVDRVKARTAAAIGVNDDSARVIFLADESPSAIDAIPTDGVLPAAPARPDVVYHLPGPFQSLTPGKCR